MRLPAITVLGTLGLVLTACSAAAPPACPEAPFAVRGPHAVGVETITDATGNLVEVWYPAAPRDAGGPRAVYDMRDWLPEATREAVPASAPTTFTMDAVRDAAPSADGPFPLILFSHGLGGYRLQSSFLMTHLASWGFVVAAPEHPERNLTRVLSGMGLADSSSTQLAAALDALARDPRVDVERIGVMGHSMGGGAVAVVIDEGLVPADAWVSLATVTFPMAVDLPGLLMGGTTDMLATPSMMATNFASLPAMPRRYVSIEGAGHLAFSDICTIGREAGGVLQIAIDAGLALDPLVVTLATDGCRPTDLPVEIAWPIIRNYVTAHFVRTLAPSTRPTGPDGLTDGSRSCFGGDVATYAQIE